MCIKFSGGSTTEFTSVAGTAVNRCLGLRVGRRVRCSFVSYGSVCTSAVRATRRSVLWRVLQSLNYGPHKSMTTLERWGRAVCV